MSLDNEVTAVNTPRAALPFRQRVGRYELPLVAIPTTLLGASSVPSPVLVPPAQVGGQRPTAISVVGLELDRRLLSHLTGLADARSSGVIVEDEVYALAPRTVRRYKARLVRAKRPLPMVEDEEELRLQAVANE